MSFSRADRSQGDLSGLTTSLAADAARGSGLRVVTAAAALVAMDLLALYGASLALALAAPTERETALPVLLLAAAVQVGLKAFLGLYPGYGLHLDAILRRMAQAWAGAVLTVTASVLLLRDADIGTLLAVVATLLLALLLQLGLARAIRFGLEQTGLWGVPVLVLGAPDRVLALEDYLRAHGEHGYFPARRPEDAGIVLWAGDGETDAETLAQLRRRQRQVLIVSDLPKIGLSGFQPADHGGAIGLRLARPGGSARQGAVKRGFDVTFALMALSCAAPVIGLAALAIKLVDPGPAFYTQTREGLGGRRIGVLKLRTMYRDSDRMLKELLDRDPEARQEWETRFKLRNDPRILPVIGRFLRASSLDELPQLINIIRGDMSLVGPRPFPQYHLDAMCQDFRSNRAKVVPGLTGLWQISERSDADIGVQQSLDGYYLENRSFWFDIAIILRTFIAVVGSKGAY